MANAVTYNYVVSYYSDYRKEVSCGLLKSFSNKDKALEFAKKYCSDEFQRSEYVSSSDSIFDAPIAEDDEAKYKKVQKEFPQLRHMFSVRLAVSKVPHQAD